MDISMFHYPLELITSSERDVEKNSQRTGSNQRTTLHSPTENNNRKISVRITEMSWI